MKRLVWVLEWLPQIDISFLDTVDQLVLVLRLILGALGTQGESTPIDHIGSHGECPVCFGIAQQKKQAEYSKQRTTWRDEHPPKPTSKD